MQSRPRRVDLELRDNKLTHDIISFVLLCSATAIPKTLSSESFKTHYIQTHGVGGKGIVTALEIIATANE